MSNMEEITKAMDLIRKQVIVYPNAYKYPYQLLTYGHMEPYANLPPVYCFDCGREVGRAMKSQHLCVRGSSVCCLEATFCNEACQTIWNFKNVDRLDNAGPHGTGYQYSTEQHNMLMVPALRDRTPWKAKTHVVKLGL